MRSLVTFFRAARPARLPSYDDRGQLTSDTEGSGAGARTTTIAYNERGQPASSTDPGGATTTFTYDAAGHVLSQTLPSGQTLTFAYDAAGNRTSSTDAQGVRTAYEYDLQNRLTAAVLDPATQEALAGRPVVFLRVGLADASKRVGLGHGRPLLLGDVRSRIKKLLDERTPVYESVAALVVDTDGRAPLDIAAEIATAIAAMDPKETR